MHKNPILLADSYKFSHYLQLPEGTTNDFSYLEARGGLFRENVFFGLQYILLEYLQKPFTEKDIDEAEELINSHMGTVFNRAGFEYILRNYGGHWPIRIRAVPEGTVVPIRNVLMTIEATDPKCAWVVGFLETLLMQVWFPITVATISRECKSLILDGRKASSDDLNVDFALHDFGYRGVSSQESAGLGGVAHLVNFRGTDTVAALSFAREYYGANVTPAFSIPASEHRTITAWPHEGDAFANMLKRWPKGLVACVSDTYNIYSACRSLWGLAFHNEVMAREGTLVVRPDSGSPEEVVPKVLQELWNAFGGNKNSKGMLVLDPHVRVIQGDGIDVHTIPEILNSIMRAGFSTENVSFGMGGGLLQKLNRDTCKMAIKCSAIEQNGKWFGVAKSPITDKGKVSKKGRLALVRSGNTFQTLPEEQVPSQNNELVTVFENGKVTKLYTLDEIRERAKIV